MKSTASLRFALRSTMMASTAAAALLFTGVASAQACVTGVGTNSTACGVGAQADGNNSTAVGVDASANQPNATAVGKSAVASNNYATAVGVDSYATGEEAAAFGAQAVASGDRSVAVGRLSHAIGAESFAGGYRAETLGVASVAIGNYSQAGDLSLALGSDAKALNTNSVALGAGTATTRDNQIVLGAAGQTITARRHPTAAATAAQTGTIGIVTTDANGNLAADMTFINRFNSVETGFNGLMAQVPTFVADLNAANVASTTANTNSVAALAAATAAQTTATALDGQVTQRKATSPLSRPPIRLKTRRSPRLPRLRTMLSTRPTRRSLPVPKPIFEAMVAQGAASAAQTTANSRAAANAATTAQTAADGACRRYRRRRPELTGNGSGERCHRADDGQLGSHRCRRCANGGDLPLRPLLPLLNPRPTPLSRPTYAGHGYCRCPDGWQHRSRQRRDRPDRPLTSGSHRRWRCPDDGELRCDGCCCCPGFRLTRRTPASPR